MSTPFTVPTDLIVRGNVTAQSLELAQGLARSQNAQEALTAFPQKLTDARVHDAPHTVLPGTSATDDLGLYGTAFGTKAIYIATYDVKTVTSTLYGRMEMILRENYDAGNDVKIRFACGMLTTIADGSCTIDCEAYLVDRDTTAGASDLCTTAAQSMNSLTFADKDFVITATSLSPGDKLDVRFAVSVVDGATGTAVIGAIAAIDLLCDTKG